MSGLIRRKDPGQAWETEVDVGGTSQAGVAVTRSFAFAFDTPGLNDGVVVYEPAVGDLFMQAAILGITGFDGTDAKADIGTFAGTDIGFFSASGVGLSFLGTPNTQGGWTYSFAGLNEGGVIWRADTTDPLLLVVSQDGLKGGAPVGGTVGEAVLILEIVTPEPL